VQVYFHTLGSDPARDARAFGGVTDADRVDVHLVVGERLLGGRLPSQPFVELVVLEVVHCPSLT
jgi:hypothetical protein